MKINGSLKNGGGYTETTAAAEEAGTGRVCERFFGGGPAASET